MLDRVICDIDKYSILNGKSTIIIAVSGGPDSICLMDIFAKIKEKYQLKLFCVHINHMLRDIDSDNDEKFVNKLCKTYEIECFTSKVDVKAFSQENKLSIEESARELRHSELKKYLKELSANAIATGHNKNDQAETLLMRILRGTGTLGLQGMNYCDGNIIRPLLGIDRKEILNYTKKENLEYRIDNSNSENIFTRNKIRLDLIPFITENFNSNIIENLYKLSFQIREDNSFIDKVSDRYYDECVFSDNKNIIVKINEIIKYEKSIINRIIKRILSNLTGSNRNFEFKHYLKINELLFTKITGKKINLPNKVIIIKDYEFIKFSISKEELIKDKHIEDKEYKILNIPGKMRYESVEIIAEILEKQNFDFNDINNVNEKSKIQYFDLDLFQKPIHIRHRMDGDKIFPYLSNGFKKLKKFFIDEKISRDLRDEFVLLACENEILWIFGLRSSNRYRISENTTNILKITYKTVR